MKSHYWLPISPGIAYNYCNRCGLINLRNKISLKLAKKPCPGKDEDD